VAEPAPAGEAVHGPGLVPGSAVTPLLQAQPLDVRDVESRAAVRPSTPASLLSDPASGAALSQSIQSEGLPQPQPGAARQRSEAALALVDRGIEPGSPAYNREMAAFDRQQAERQQVAEPVTSGVAPLGGPRFDPVAAERGFEQSLRARGLEPSALTATYREQLSDAPFRQAQLGEEFGQTLPSPFDTRPIQGAGEDRASQIERRLLGLEGTGRRGGSGQGIRGRSAEAGRADATLAALLAEQQRRMRGRYAGGVSPLAGVLAGAR